jgi:hypothetical protein
MIPVEDTLIAFSFDNLEFEADEIRSRWDVILKMTADFSVQIRGKCYSHWSYFNVIEFGGQLCSWLQSGARKGRPFSYDSIELEDPGIIGFTFVGTGWRISALEPKYEADLELSLEEIEACAESYFANLKRACLDRFHVDVSGFLGGG